MEMLKLLRVQRSTGSACTLFGGLIEFSQLLTRSGRKRRRHDRNFRRIAIPQP